MAEGDEPVKQVLVIRRDLGMRRGKEIAQGSHASMAFLLRKIRLAADGFWPPPGGDRPGIHDILQLDPNERAWVSGGMTAKVVLQAKDLEELLEVERLCQEAGLEPCLVTDAGLTEFQGPTVTALAIGPAASSRIDAITGPAGKRPLKLY